MIWAYIRGGLSIWLTRVTKSQRWIRLGTFSQEQLVSQIPARHETQAKEHQRQLPAMVRVVHDVAA